MKTILSILILAFVFNSCKKEEPAGFFRDCDVGITVKDKGGMDLLNSSNPGAYLERNSKIYYLSNGVKQEVLHPTASHPRNFYISEEAEPDGKFWMTVFLYSSPAEEYPITYIEWGENNTDTLKSEIYRSEGMVMVKNIWLNGSLVWNWEDYSTARTFEIFK
jgi:hypothetical protein